MTADTQTPGGWPDAARPGVPMEPERDGWHWLQWVGLFPADTLGHTNPVARYWEKDGWWDGSMHRHARYWQQGWRYVAPCLTPAEVAAREAAARREGIEAALAAVDAEPEPEGDMPAKLANTDRRILVLATVRATKRGIDGRIRALLEDAR